MHKYIYLKQRSQRPSCTVIHTDPTVMCGVITVEKRFLMTFWRDKKVIQCDFVFFPAASFPKIISLTSRSYKNLFHREAKTVSQQSPFLMSSLFIYTEPNQADIMRPMWSFTLHATVPEAKRRDSVTQQLRHLVCHITWVLWSSFSCSTLVSELRAVLW